LSSPRSPGYHSPSVSNTPSSQNPNTSYTPNTPSYNRAGVYVPTSPAYDPSRTIHEEEGNLKIENLFYLKFQVKKKKRMKKRKKNK